MATLWTWPLVLHLRYTVPGDPGDNYLFLWNLWWMRHVLATPGLEYFRTTYLFYPFGTNLVNASHTALPALVAATLFKQASVVTAQNILLLLYVFANMATMYALAWEVTGQRRAAVLSGVVFGLSPYLAAHLPGHFELMAAWVLPAFALLLRRAVHESSFTAAVAAGVILTACAYTVYYYVIYSVFFAIVYVFAWCDAFAIAWSARPRTPLVVRAQWAFAGLIAVCVAAALFIGVTGGGVAAFGPFSISATAPQNPLTVMWLFGIGWAACAFRPAVSLEPTGLARLRKALAPIALAMAVFVAGVAPLAWQAARLVERGEYVTPAYQWRSAPHGVDLVAPLLGHPRHPLMQALSRRAYAAAHLDPIEAIGWMGIVPVLLVCCMRAHADGRRDDRIWCSVFAAFGVWALGPYLTVGGFDTGLKLPAILLRYVPIVANARMPARAMVGVFMALAIVIAVRVGSAAGRLRSPQLQWLVIAIVAFEYADAPIPLTRPDAPAVYRTLARLAPGAVCEVPLGVADGLGPGVGVQDRRTLFYATLHEHPIVGGYISRMPEDAAGRYGQMPIAGTLLRLSDGGSEAAPSEPLPDNTQSPCRYVVVNRAGSSTALLAYIERLHLNLIESADGRDLYQVR